MEYKGVEIKWLGHAAVQITSGDTVVYIDPYQIGRGRPDASYVFVTHNHYDHLSIEDIDPVLTKDTVLLAPEDCREKLDDLQGKLRIVKAGQHLELPDLTVEVVKAYNHEKKFHPAHKGWVGYVLTLGDVRIYHAGDTDHIPEMKEIDVDVALLPVSGTYVMTAEEAAQATKSLKCKVAIPMHWGSFIGDDQDAETFKKKAKCKVEILDKD